MPEPTDFSIDTKSLDDIVAKLRLRADRMVADAVVEGTMRANRPPPGKPGKAYGHVTYLRGRRIGRAIGSPSLQANWVERVMYHRLLDFWGDW